MEAALLSGLVSITLTKLVSLAGKKYKLWKKTKYKAIKAGMEFLEKELGMIQSVIDHQQASPGKGGPEKVLSLTIKDLRILAQDIEDCVDRLAYLVTWKQQAGMLDFGPERLPTLVEIAKEIDRLCQTKVQVIDRNVTFKELVRPTSSPCLVLSPSSSCLSDEPVFEAASPVGMDLPLRELRQLAEGQPRRLKVISIVGFRGLGKTALASQLYRLYDSEDGQQFRLRAWVYAADRTPDDVIAEIHQKLHNSTRYLLVIDDVRVSSIIKSAFSISDNSGSVIVVTTTMQSVANACTSCSDHVGFVYQMKRLDKKDSKELFSKKACEEGFENYPHEETEGVLRKCDGQALALVTVGECLREKGWPIGEACKYVCNQLRVDLEKDDNMALGPMRRALVHDYSSLSDPDVKMCLLYFGMFPIDHRIRRKRLIRRWLAEGFVEEKPLVSTLDDQAVKNFGKLLDRNIIEPIHVSNNKQVKTCQTYGMMREFLLIKSISQDFICLLGDDKLQPRSPYVRRLSLHQKPQPRATENIDFSLLKSLMVFGEAGDHLLDFSKYQLLRVLDLGECTDLEDNHLKGVCGLLLLKYLSLGGNVTSLPREIKQLELLETLDLRGTDVKILRKEVIMLSCLIHLFGMFKLPDDLSNAVVKSMAKKSSLETLAGFFTDESRGFPQAMIHMKNLTKVKIRCERTTSSTNLTHLQDGIQKFISGDLAGTSTRSLSLHFDGCSEEFLSSLKAPCFLTSLKLHGELQRLPQFVKSMSALSELCLSSKTRLTVGLLEALGELTCLKYLSLIAHDLDIFTIRASSSTTKKTAPFPRLLRLRFELECPTFPTIEEKALPYLVTLQLLCTSLGGFSGIKIKCLERLKEVNLLRGVTEETIKLWESAAEKHCNRPKVVVLESVDTAESEPTDSSASEQSQD